MFDRSAGWDLELWKLWVWGTWSSPLTPGSGFQVSQGKKRNISEEEKHFVIFENIFQGCGSHWWKIDFSSSSADISEIIFQYWHSDVSSDKRCNSKKYFSDAGNTWVFGFWRSEMFLNQISESTLVRWAHPEQNCQL